MCVCACIIFEFTNAVNKYQHLNMQQEQLKVAPQLYCCASPRAQHVSRLAAQRNILLQPPANCLLVGVSKAASAAQHDLQQVHPEESSQTSCKRAILCIQNSTLSSRRPVAKPRGSVTSKNSRLEKNGCRYFGVGSSRRLLCYTEYCCTSNASRYSMHTAIYIHTLQQYDTNSCMAQRC